ncbi:hypothetical protein [Pasteuria penetrans]|nr:hypothetical protein [Pasteuria penetrans]
MMITKKDKEIDPNVPSPPLTNEVELISLEEIESEYEGMVLVLELKVS